MGYVVYRHMVRTDWNMLGMGTGQRVKYCLANDVFLAIKNACIAKEEDATTAAATTEAEQQ